MAEDKWARLHRLYDPQDLIRDPDIAGSRTFPPGVTGAAGGFGAGLTEEDFRRRIDDGDRERDPEER